MKQIPFHINMRYILLFDRLTNANADIKLCVTSALDEISRMNVIVHGVTSQCFINFSLNKQVETTKRSRIIKTIAALPV
jgi:hypothetical protein